MVSENVFFDRHKTDASQGCNVLIVYDNLAAGQRAMRLCWDLASEQDLGFQPQLWRLDLLVEPICGGFALADAVNADLLIISISSQSELAGAAQKWLKQCLARKRGTESALIVLFGTDNLVNGANVQNLQFLQSAAKEAGLDFFAPSANRKDGLANCRPKAEPATVAPQCIEEARALAVRQIAQAHPPAMLRAFGRDTNYRDWGIND